MVSKSLLDMIKSLFKNIYKNEKLFWVIVILVSLLLIYLRYQKWKRDQLKYQRLGANIRQKLGFVESFKGDRRSIVKSTVDSKNSNHDIIHYSYYKSNKHDSYNLLNRDLLLNKGSNDGLIEHMENQELADLFPDMDKSGFAMSEDQSDKDLLVKPDFKVEAPQMSDALLKMDTRPSEQKELDDFLQNLYMYLFLCRKSLLAEISKKRDLSKSTKLSLYFSLLRDTFQNVKRTYANYIKMKLTPGYTSDPSLDKRANILLDDDESVGITTQLLDIYDNLLAKRDVEENTKELEEMVIPPPVDGALSEEDGEEDDGEEKDPVIILREFADTLDDLYDTANSIISPYYNYVYELGIIPPPTDEKEGAVMIASFTSEMNSFIANYNDLMILTITHEELFAKLSVKGVRLSDVLSLPNISSSNLQNLKQLIKSKVINESMVNSFEKSIEDITIIYQYFNALYQLSQITVSAEEIDVERIEQILRGSQSYNAQGDRYTLFKKYDPPADGDNDNFTFGLKRTGRELLFVSMVDGFTTEKSLPAVPNKDSVSKAKKKDEVAKAFDKMGDTIAQGTTQVANEIAKGTTQVANEIAKGTVEVAKKADKELKKVGKSMKKAFRIK